MVDNLLTRERLSIASGLVSSSDELNADSEVSGFFLYYMHGNPYFNSRSSQAVVSGGDGLVHPLGFEEVKARAVDNAVRLAAAWRDDPSVISSFQLVPSGLESSVYQGAVLFRRGVNGVSGGSFRVLSVASYIPPVCEAVALRLGLSFGFASPSYIGHVLSLSHNGLYLDLEALVRSKWRSDK